MPPKLIPKYTNQQYDDLQVESQHQEIVKRQAIEDDVELSEFVNQLSIGIRGRIKTTRSPK